MEKQEKKIEEISFEERWKKAIKSLRENQQLTDTDPFAGNLPEKMPDRFKILCKHPLHQKQQAEAGNPQNADDGGIEEVESQRQSCDGGGQIQQPYRSKAQSGVQQHLQGQLQRRSEQPQAHHHQKQQHKSQRYFFYDGHDFPPFIFPAGTQAGSIGSGTDPRSCTERPCMAFIFRSRKS